MKGNKAMLSPFKKAQASYSSSACVVDGKLILSFPNAQKPVVWQMDLGDAKSSALEVREQKEGSFSLILKTAKGDEADIAPFHSQKDAVNALMAVTSALQNAHGQIRPAGGEPYHAPSNQSSTNKKAQTKKWIVLTAIIITTILLIGFIKANQTGQDIPPQSTASPANTTIQSPSAAAQTPGVPVSADEYLLGR